MRTPDYETTADLLADEPKWHGRPVTRTARADDRTLVTVRGRARWGYHAFAEYSDGLETASVGRGFDSSWSTTLRLLLADLDREIAGNRLRAVSRAEMLRSNDVYVDHIARRVLDAGPGTYGRRELRDELIARGVDAGIEHATIARLIGTGRDAVYRALDRRKVDPTLP